MSEYVFELKGVTMDYRVKKPIQILSKIFPMKNRTPVPSRIRALDDISFNLPYGVKVGILGRNGAGKSTLIKLLAGIYSPDSGSVKINTDSISLLALGVGFDNSLPGWDNIYLNSMLRGATKKQVDEKVEEIIDFSGLREFIYNPVKTYSSGMRARLAFSIAVHFEPDVLLLDEALSVGDAEFSAKSSEKMSELIRDKKRTVVMVSHNLSQLEKECDLAIWLEHGKIKMMGDPKEVVVGYRTDFHTEKK